MSLRAVVDLRNLVKTTLERADLPGWTWTVQGLGMLRCYTSNGDRITIWHEDLVYPGVTRVHDHPWDLESTVLSGDVYDHVYSLGGFRGSDVYTRYLITAGEGRPSYPETVLLFKVATKVLSVGDTYRHAWSDVHSTSFSNGAVTYCRRSNRQGQMARVYVPAGEEYGSAEPRPATPEEVDKYAGLALEGWE